MAENRVNLLTPLRFSENGRKLLKHLAHNIQLCIALVHPIYIESKTFIDRFSNGIKRSCRESAENGIG